MVGARFPSDLPDAFRDPPEDPPLPAISEVGTTVAPHALDFNRRRTNFEIDLAEAFRKVSNGIRVPTALDPAIAREHRYQQWLLRIGSGTRPEFMIFEALERRGFRGDVSEEPGSDFSYQVPLLGGRNELGGAVIDFVVWAIAPPVAIRVQGEFFHFGDDDVEASDILQKIQIESLGFTVADILAQETITEEQANKALHAALLGFESDFTGRKTTF